MARPYIKLYEQEGHPLRLVETDEQNPYEKLNECFVNYHLEEWKEFLHEMVGVCLTTDNEEFAEPSQRACLLHMSRELEGLLEAADQIAKESS